MTKHRVRVPQVADISAAIRLYYEHTEIGNRTSGLFSAIWETAGSAGLSSLCLKQCTNEAQCTITHSTSTQRLLMTFGE